MAGVEHALKASEEVYVTAAGEGDGGVAGAEGEMAEGVGENRAADRAAGLVGPGTPAAAGKEATRGTGSRKKKIQ